MQEREDRIMELDLDKVTPYMRDYYMKLQQQIMARVLEPREADPGQAP